jgi:hypothetical protein
MTEFKLLFLIGTIDTIHVIASPENSVLSEDYCLLELDAM